MTPLRIAPPGLRRSALVLAAGILIATPILAAPGKARWDFLWLEAKFNFGILLILLLAIGSLFAGSWWGRRRRNHRAAEQSAGSNRSAAA
jgi:hypothetical protein